MYSLILVTTSSRPLFFGVVIEFDLNRIKAEVSEFSSPLLRGGCRLVCERHAVEDVEFSSPVLRGGYRIRNVKHLVNEEVVLVPCSPGWLSNR